MLITNLGVPSWGRIFNDAPMVAAAILDRLLHRSVVFNITVESYRMRTHRASATSPPARHEHRPDPVAGRPRDDDLPGLPALLHPHRPSDLLQHCLPQDRVPAPTPRPDRCRHRPRREFTTYECPECGERFLGEQRCDQCGTFGRRVGLGGPCPHCLPIALNDLLDQEMNTVAKR